MKYICELQILIINKIYWFICDFSLSEILGFVIYVLPYISKRFKNYI